MPLRRKKAKSTADPARAILAGDQASRAEETNGAISEAQPPAVEASAVAPPSSNGEAAPMMPEQGSDATDMAAAAPGPGPVPATDGDQQPVDGDRRRVDGNHRPVDGNHRPAGDRGLGGLVSRVYGDPGSSSRDQRDRQAAAEFEAAMAPVLQMAMSAVPDASSPEDAVRTLADRQEQLEVRPDPMGGAYVPGDSYETDARVYYRLLRRDYEKNPRPSKSPMAPFRTLPSAWRGP